MPADRTLPSPLLSQELRPLLVEKPLQIFGYDVDIMGIVHNLVYPRWFEELRTLFLDRYWPLEGMLKEQECPMILTTHVEYKAPLTIFDKPVGRLWAAEIGKVRWKVMAEIATEQTLHCTGYQVGIILHLETRKPVRLPDHIVEKYQADCDRLQAQAAGGNGSAVIP
jgi:acyl-CoA thioester hydrolase